MLSAASSSGFLVQTKTLRDFPFPRAAAIAALLCLWVAGSAQRADSQAFSNLDRGRVRDMLGAIKDDIKKYYYDPKYRDVDVDATFRAADERIKQANSFGQAFGAIAQALNQFDDSHTFFLPPQRASRTDYGWQMQMIGDACYVTAVRPGSDAEAKGLKRGDMVLAVDRFQPNRENLWKLNYIYYALNPQPAMRLTVQGPEGAQRQVDVLAKVTESKRIYDLTAATGGRDIWDLIREGENEGRLHRHRTYEFKDDLFIWKMPAFDLSEEEVDSMMGKARGHKTLILDLRGNGGGAVITLLRLLGYFVESEVKIGEVKRRNETKPLLVKARGDRRFNGKLIVLVDNKSGSASEVFARAAQLEKLGKVIGDRTGGAVMEARRYGHHVGTDTAIFFGASITDADLIMSDGKSLERVGVTPDEVRLPTAADLAAKRDPVLAHAAALAGIPIPPEKAGELFPLEWRK
jgi:C-terminal processing protease CtpA/Prc